jgi:ATP-binding cassette subfamily B (MDR/TAP) protein 1
MISAIPRTAADFLSFTVIFAIIAAAAAMTTVAPHSMAITKASSSAEELFKTIDRVSEIDPLSQEGLVPAKCEGVIEIKDITFSYPARPDTTVLEGLDLFAPAHKTTALVGSSGSGKSTIIGLLGTCSRVLHQQPISDSLKERWYDQSSGTILLDGVDIRELNLTWFRTNVRLVQQEPVLFSGTVYENVASGLFGTEKAGLPQHEQRALIEKACKDAYADEFITRLPKVSFHRDRLHHDCL